MEMIAGGVLGEAVCDEQRQSAEVRIGQTFKGAGRDRLKAIDRDEVVGGVRACDRAGTEHPEDERGNWQGALIQSSSLTKPAQWRRVFNAAAGGSARRALHVRK